MKDTITKQVIAINVIHHSTRYIPTPHPPGAPGTVDPGTSPVEFLPGALVHQVAGHQFLCNVLFYIEPLVYNLYELIYL
jgi:hypothetical protein